MHMMISKFYLALLIVMTIFAICPVVSANHVVIDSCDYKTAADAAKTWTTSCSASTPVPATIDNVRCFRLTSDFSAGKHGTDLAGGDWSGSDSARAIWNKSVNLDLSGLSYIYLKVKIPNPASFTMIHLLVGTENGGWYDWLWDPFPRVTSQWQIIRLKESSCYADGDVSWSKVRTIRITASAGTKGSPNFYVAGIGAVTNGSSNMLSNSGFEFCTTERLPDYWGTGDWGLIKDAWITDTDSWRAQWGVDNTVSHSGKRSMRIVGNGDPQELELVSFFVRLAGTYTISAWMKSDRQNLPVTIKSNIYQKPEVAGQQFAVSTTWKRYTMNITQSGLERVFIRNDSNGGTLWVDDVQLEKGTVATDYKPADTDMSLTGKAVHRAVPPVKEHVIIPGSDSISVKIDSSRRFLVDGKPFIPYAASWEIPVSPARIEHTAKSGFNTVVLWASSGRTLEQLRTALDLAKANGLKVILAASPSIDALGEWITALKNHPAILAWYVFDEPYNDRLRKEAVERYNIAKELDPSRPAMINYTSYNGDELGDIASLDNYPIPSALPCALGVYTDALMRAGKPAWIWAQCCGYGYYLMYRDPTGPEAEGMIYSSLVHGGRGFMYFANKPHSKELWDTMCRIGHEVEVLTPILYSLETSPNVKCNSQDIEFVAKTYNGQQYIIASNKKPTLVRATFSISGSPAAGATRLFENRNVCIKHGKLEDAFAGYQRHVYRLGKK